MGIGDQTGWEDESQTLDLIPFGDQKFLDTSASSLCWEQLGRVKLLLCSRMQLMCAVLTSHPSLIPSPLGSPGWEHPTSPGHTPNLFRAQISISQHSQITPRISGRRSSPSKHSPAQQSPSPGPRRLCRFCFLPISPLAEPQTLGQNQNLKLR